MGPVMAVLESENGRPTDVGRELVSKARDVAAALNTTTVAVAFGPDASEVLGRIGVDTAVALGGPGSRPYSPPAYEHALAAAIRETGATIVLLPNTTLGMDLGAALAVQLQYAMVAYVVGLEVEAGGLVATSQVYGGKLLADVAIPGEGAIVTVIPGSWPAQAVDWTPGRILERTVEAVEGLAAVREIAPDAAGDVDITRADILVSVGRGIGGPENLDRVQELADALGGVVSCSRPVVDAGWLPRSRQVGKSGQTVKPKLYLALGISGAPEHLQGMKDSELIVAVNTDPQAPIFEVAHFGATVDVLELIPILTERLREGAG